MTSSNVSRLEVIHFQHPEIYYLRLLGHLLRCALKLRRLMLGFLNEPPLWRLGALAILDQLRTQRNVHVQIECPHIPDDEFK